MPFFVGIGVKLAFVLGLATGAAIAAHKDTIEALWNDRENVLNEIKQIVQKRGSKVAVCEGQHSFEEHCDNDRGGFEIDHCDSDKGGFEINHSHSGSDKEGFEINHSDEDRSTLRRRHGFTMPMPDSSGTLPSMSEPDSEFSEYSVIHSAWETDS